MTSCLFINFNERVSVYNVLAWIEFDKDFVVGVVYSSIQRMLWTVTLMSCQPIEFNLIAS